MPCPMARCVLLLTTLAALFTIALSIRCWVCRSYSDPKCGDPFDNRTLPITDCDIQSHNHLRDPEDKRRPLKATMCRKIRQKVDGVWRIIRDCAFLGSPGEGTGNEHHCHIVQGTHNVYVETCTCNSKDGCNSAPRHVYNANTWLLFVPTVWLLVNLASNF